MIHEVTGDLLLSRAQVIAHGVAPLDDFKTGLALALRENWPAMAKDYRHYCHTQSPKPGSLWMWGGAGGMRIANLLTQEPAAIAGGHPGKAELSHVNHALHALAKVVKDEKFTSVALPRLACGVGGLDWANVRPLIETTLGGLGIPVYVYASYKKGIAAQETGLPGK